MQIAMDSDGRTRSIPVRRARIAGANRAIHDASGRRGRRFKSCHPDQCRRSLTCANAALRWPVSHPAPQQRPRRNKNGTRGNHRESRGRLRQAPGLPAQHSRPHGTADPTAQQGPSGHSDPPSATKRPFGRNARPPGSSADPKSAKLFRLGTVTERRLGGGFSRP